MIELKTHMYDHQQKAFDKLKKIKVGALYMGMGTGKTRTALELIAKRYNEGKVDHILWLCPCSAKENIRRDLLKHVGEDISMFTICGIETLSSSIRVNAKLLDLVQKKRVYLVVDESNLVKNHMALRTENITRLASHCSYKNILNGTPISRCEKDLYSQWYILDWRILGYQSFWSFAANHLEYDERIPGKINRCLNVDYLVKKIAPYTYQVTKEECLDLPPKSYETHYYRLTRSQREHYCEVVEILLSEVDEFEPYTLYRLFSGLQSVISGFEVRIGEKLTRRPFFEKPEDNPRIEALMELISKIDSKNIIFCKYTQEIIDIVNLLNKEYGEGAAVPFYGGLNLRKRQENIDRFAGDSRFFVANKACAGYSLNLQFCNYVTYYSNDWDYATREQSEDRTHRIGQDKNVLISDICAVNTLDERILKCLRRKENLADAFKNEISRQQDKEYLELWLHGKTFKGRNYRKKVKVNEYEDLKEEDCV